MNDEVKEILIDLIDYYNAIGTKDDPGTQVFENVVQRSSEALKRYAIEQKSHETQRSLDVDPFSMNVLEETSPFKHEMDLF